METRLKHCLGPALIVAILVAASTMVRADDYTGALDATNTGLGNHASASSSEAAVFSPAILIHDTPHRLISLTTHRPFGLTELQTYSASVATFGPRLGLAMGAQTSGDDLMRESTVHAALAVGIGQHTGLGVTTELDDISVSGYKRTLSAALNLGVSYRRDRWDANAAVVAAASTSWGDLAWDRPRRTVFGGRYHLTDEVHVHGGVTIHTIKRRSSAAGIMFSPRPWIDMSLSRSSGPDGFAGGVQVRSGGYGLGYAVRLHPELDATHAFTAILDW
jgi:hypothetical protein